MCVCVCVCEPESEDRSEEMLKMVERFQQLAELYHVYHSVQRYTVRACPDPRSA